MTQEEYKTYKTIDFDPEEYRKQIGTNQLLYHGLESKERTLTHRWRYPSLSIHGRYFKIFNHSLVSWFPLLVDREALNFNPF